MSVDGGGFTVVIRLCSAPAGRLAATWHPAGVERRCLSEAVVPRSFLPSFGDALISSAHGPERFRSGDRTRRRCAPFCLLPSPRILLTCRRVQRVRGGRRPWAVTAGPFDPLAAAAARPSICAEEASCPRVVLIRVWADPARNDTDPAGITASARTHRSSWSRQSLEAFTSPGGAHPNHLRP